MSETPYNKEEIKALNDIFLQLQYPSTVRGNFKNTFICIDSLICIPSNRSDIINNRVENFGYYFASLDSSYKQLLIQLIQCKKSIYLDVGAINKTGSYIIISSEKSLIDRSKTIGVLKYSRIVFDSSFTKGVLYTSLECGGECGEEMILFIKKESNKWIPLAKNTLVES